MKINFYKPILIFLTLIVLFVLYSNPISARGKLKENTYNKRSENIISDKKKKKKIAEIVWINVYGKLIYESKPFICTENKRKDRWIVKGTKIQSKGKNIIVFGGVPYIEIRKKDCRIMKISHGK